MWEYFPEFYQNNKVIIIDNLFGFLLKLWATIKWQNIQLSAYSQYNLTDIFLLDNGVIL